MFTHELIRSTLLGALSLPRRQRLHARVAETMEKQYESGLEQHASAMARHLYEAGAAADETKTAQFLTLAADQALETGAFEAAHRDTERALALVSDDDRARRAGLLRTRGLARRSLGRWPDAVVDWDAAVSLYEAEGNARGVATTCRELAHLYTWMIQPVQVVAAASRGLNALGPEASPDRCLLLGYLGVGHGFAGEFEAGSAESRSAVAMAETIGDPLLEGRMRLLSAFSCIGANLRREHAEHCRRAIELLRASGDLGHLAEALGQQLYSFVWTGRPKYVATIEDETAALGGRLGLANVEALATLYAGTRDWMFAPALDRLDDVVKRGVAFLEKMGAGMPWIIESYLARAALWRGRLNAARDHGQAAFSAEPPDVYSTGRGWGMLFLCECMLGNVPAALSLLAKQRGGLPTSGRLNSEGAWQALFAVVEGLAVADQRARAAELYPLMLEATETGTVVTHMADHLVETLTAMAAACGQDWEAATTHYETALELANEMPFVSEQAEARYWYARMLVDRDEPGDRERARELLGTALEVYRRIGMPWHIERAEALVGDSLKRE